MTETVYLAILKTDRFTLELEYLPGPDGTIEIVSANITPRPACRWQERRHKTRRGLILTEQDERREAMLPTIRLEAR